MIHKMVRFRVKPEKREAARAAIAEFVASVRAKEPDTLQYEAFEEPDGVWFVHFMTFRSPAAEQLHRATPHVIRFVDVLYPNCDVTPVFTDLKLVRSSSLPDAADPKRN